MHHFIKSVAVAASIFFAGQTAHSATGASAAPVVRSVSRFEITVTTVESDGTKTIQTRSLGAAEAATFFLGETTKDASSGAPPLPNPPLPGSVPVSTTRVDYHQEVQGWTRDTSYGRVPGGPWQLMNDHLIRTDPPKCNPNDDNCGQLPN